MAVFPRIFAVLVVFFGSWFNPGSGPAPVPGPAGGGGQPAKLFPTSLRGKRCFPPLEVRWSWGGRLTTLWPGAQKGDIFKGYLTGDEAGIQNQPPPPPGHGPTSHRYPTKAPPGVGLGQARPETRPGRKVRVSQKKNDVQNVFKGVQNPRETAPKSYKCTICPKTCQSGSKFAKKHEL